LVGNSQFYTATYHIFTRPNSLITTNLTFKEWDTVFLNPMVTSAAIDRVIDHSQIFEFKNELSFRTEVAQKKLQNIK
jgi:DNA replication protein DnaC